MKLSISASLDKAILDMFAFEDELTRLSLKIYPSKTLREFITDELSPIVRQLREILANEKLLIDSNPSHTPTPRARAAYYVWSIGSLQIVSSALAGTDLQSHPIEIMDAFREIVKGIDNTDFEIVTVSTNMLNFTFREIWQPVKRILQNEVGIVSSTTKNFIELTFPQQHKDNVLLAAIYAHEIGHYFDRTKQIWQKIYTQIVHSNGLKQLVPFSRGKNGTPLSEAELFALLADTSLGSWIQEAIADCVAVYLLGPAFVFSFSEIILSFHGMHMMTYDQLVDIPSKTHPRNGLRVKFQLDTINNLGLYGNLGAELQQVLDDFRNDWNNATVYFPDDEISNNNMSLTLNATSYPLLEAIWGQALPLVEAEVSAMIGAQKITPEQIVEAHILAQERASWLVPPNELDGRVASVQSIINSGWITRLIHKQDVVKLVTKLDGQRADFDFTNLINSLLRYALNVALIHRRWTS